MEISNLTIGRKNGRIFLKKKEASFTLGYKCASKGKKRKGKKESQPIKEKNKRKNRKRKKKIWKGSLDQTMSEQMCRIVKSKRKGQATVTITWLKPKGCTKQSPS